MNNSPMRQGELLKRYGLDLVEKHNPDFVDLVRGYAREHAWKYGQVTSDDCRLWANLNDIYPLHHNAWGAVFRGPEWQRVGFTQSQIPSNHARMISIWRAT